MQVKVLAAVPLVVWAMVVRAARLPAAALGLALGALLLAERLLRRGTARTRTPPPM